MTKKENIINFIIVCVVILIVGAVAIFLINNNQKESYLHKLSISELREKIDNRDSFILIFTQDTCSHCKSYLPVVEKIANQYKIDFYDISSTGLSDDELAYLRSIATYTGTPTTIFIVDGEEKNTLLRLDGDVPEYRLIERLKTMGYINE